MTNTEKFLDRERGGQPSLSDLMSRYLQKQSEAHATGLAEVGRGDVRPFDAGPVQPIDAKPAWQEAVTVAGFLAPNNQQEWQAPPGWPQLVASQEPLFDLAFSLGNFPQLVRNLQPLMQTANAQELREMGSNQNLDVPALAHWAQEAFCRKQFPQILMALGSLRLARQFDLARELLSSWKGEIPQEWQILWDNEKAALAWHRGQGEAARKMWTQMPASPPVLFNRGMAALFLNDKSEAYNYLTQAARQLPETSAWHHLARLYLTLAAEGVGG